MDEHQAVDDCLPMARALFGEQVESALETLNRHFHIVYVAADMNDAAGNDQDLARALRADLSSSSGTDRQNEMNDIIAAQVKLIEDGLLPVLRLEK